MSILRSFLIAAVALIMTAVFAASAANADALENGNAIITGFSGTKAADAAPGGDPLDETFIDLDGASMQIQSPQPEGPPDGQLISAPVTFKAKASEVGQVFAIGLDEGDETAEEESVPNIYLGATSAFGIQIVLPDSDGDGRPERVKNGHPNAEWMPGQFGPDGGPGSIWKVDGKSGAISLFATIPGNTGAGIGDIVYDRATRQFFVSDLDTGLIHRLSGDGTPIDVFDHGEAGRAAEGLDEVPDDGRSMDIKDPAFDALNTDTWGLAPPERMVWGLGIHGGRLYYAVASGPEIWSVGINLDGSFGDDPRREIEVKGTPRNFPISDIAFDNQGAMYVAQRGGIKGSWDYVSFTEPKKSVVFRFKRELPDDPETSGTWVPIPDEYAVGFPPDYRNTSGGIALGYGFDELGKVVPGTCGQMLWTTGDDLRDNPEFAGELAAGGPAAVHGLQGNDRALIRPDNEPPAVAYFVDYDGKSEDPEKSGHVGDVEVLQPCADEGPGTEFVYELPPWTGDEPPPRTPTDSFNLEVQKVAQPKECWAGGAGWQCDYAIRVTNTGTSPYFGDVTVTDWLFDAPAGASMRLGPLPWSCIAVSATEQQCTHPGVQLYPGESIDLFVTAEFPTSDPRCSLDNGVRIDWAAGYGDSEPADDVAFGSASVPSAACSAPVPRGEKSNLLIKKDSYGGSCSIVGTDYICPFVIQVTNTGPGFYGNNIEIDETLSSAATSASFTPGWTCTGSGANYHCTLPSVGLNPGDSVFLAAAFVVPQTIATCELGNRADITFSPGGSDANSDPGDDSATATANIPSPACIGTRTNLQLEKSPNPGSCTVVGQGWTCGYTIKVTNRGPGLHDGPIEIEDSWTNIPAGWSQTLPSTWSCNTTSPPDFRCTIPALQLAPGQSVQDTVWIWIPASTGGTTCRQANVAAILQPAPGSDQNTDSGDDKDDATAAFNLLVTPAGESVCGALDISLEERSGPLPPSHKNDDEKEEKADDDKEPVCPTGWTKTPKPGKCCPHGTSWDGERCKRGPSLPDPGNEQSPPQCWDGWEKIGAKDIKSYIKDGHKVRPRREDDQTIWCAKKVSTPTPDCWSGWEKIGAKDTKSYIEDGYKVRPRRQGNQTVWCALKEGTSPPPPSTTPTPPPPPVEPEPPLCWSGWFEIDSDDVSARKRDGYEVRRRKEGNQATWCARKEKASCKQVWKDVCTVKPERKCRKVTDNVCQMVPRQDCRNITKQVCNMQPRQVCRNVTKQACNMQPKRQCRTVTKNECRTVPQRFCGTGEFSGCVTKNRQVCGPVNRQVCTNTMQQVCHPVNQRVCNNTMQRVCHPESQRVCNTKMQRVCSPKTRTDCTTVQKRTCTRKRETVCE